MTKCSKENCKTCKHHDVFWEHGGCNLMNGMEEPKYEKKDEYKVSKDETDNRTCL